MIEPLVDEFSNFREFLLDNLDVLQTPNDFHCMFLERIKSCKNVYLSCLFLGIGKQCKALLNVLAERSQESKKTIVLVDKSRNIQNIELIRYINEKKLTNVIKFIDMTTSRHLPGFINELFGVYHIKVYVFDDEVCISGANLADPYFTNRIDRYYLFKNRELSQTLVETIFNEDHYKEKTEHILGDALLAICSLSPAGRCAAAGKQGPSADGGRQDPDASRVKSRDVPGSRSGHEVQTRIFAFTRDQEIAILEKILRYEYQDIHLSTAYPNFTGEHIRLLKNTSFSLYTPSSTSHTFNPLNRFYKTITRLYTYSTYKTKLYLPKCQVREYTRPGCTFHTKGMWLFGEDHCVTIIGSSNFNQRSIKIDRESSWVIISNDQKIREKLKNEVKLLKKYSKTVSMKELGKRSVRFIIILIYHVFNILI